MNDAWTKLKNWFEYYKMNTEDAGELRVIGKALGEMNKLLEEHYEGNVGHDKDVGSVSNCSECCGGSNCVSNDK